MKNKKFKINKKRVAITIIIILIVGVTIFAALNQSVKTDDEKYYLKAYNVEEQELSSIVFTSGQVDSIKRRNINFTQSGKVIELNYEVGDNVEKGDVIAKLNQEDLLSQIRNIELQIAINKKNIQKLRISGIVNYEAAYNNAKLNYEKALEIFKNNEQLFQKDVISKSEFENFKNNLALAENDYTSTKKKYEGYGNGIDLEIAKLQLEESKSQLTDLKNKLEDTIIRAPFDGVLTSNNLKLGEYAMGNSEGVIIETVDDLIVKTDISQYDVDSINVGQAVEISRNGEDIIYEGEVSKINPIAIVSQQSSIVPVEIDIISENHYKPNYTVNVEIETESNNQAKVAPYEALVKDENNNHVIYKFDEGKAKKVIVKRGINGPLRTEIISSEINVGDVILLDPPLSLEDGNLVEIIETIN